MANSYLNTVKNMYGLGEWKYGAIAYDNWTIKKHNNVLNGENIDWTPQENGTVEQSTVNLEPKPVLWSFLMTVIFYEGTKPTEPH